MAIARLKEMIKESNNIVFFGGAGVSTESGIPDFRGEDGIFKTITEYGHRPEVILSKSFFDVNKKAFFDYYRRYLLYPDAKPNVTHYALAKLEKEGKVKAVITQNIDNLHQMAGGSSILELHGSLYRNYCIKCGTKYDTNFVISSNEIPICDICGSVVRPDIVLYEEGLDYDIITNARKSIEGADMLIVGGTSLAVYPAAGLIDYYRGNKLVLINKSVTHYDNRADLSIHMNIGEVFEKAMDYELTC